MTTNEIRQHLLVAVRSVLPNASAEEAEAAARDAFGPSRLAAQTGAQSPSAEGYLRSIFDCAAVGIALVDAEGRPLRCNPALSRMLGYTEEQLLSMHFTEFTHPDDATLDLGLYRELIDGSRDRYEIEKRYVTAHGTVLRARLTVSSARWALAHTVAIVQDVSAEHEAREEQRRLSFALNERVKELTAIQSTALLLQDGSASVPTLLQGIAEALPNAFFHPLHTEARVRYDWGIATTPGFSPEPPLLVQRFRTGDGREGVIEVAARLPGLRPDDDPFHLEERALVETLARLLGMALDRRQTEERLTLAVTAGQIVVWEWDVASGRVSWPGQSDRPAGIIPWASVTSLDAFLRLVHPDDLDSVQAALRSAVDSPESGGRYSVEYRIQGPDGSVRWLLASGQLLRDPDGRPHRLLGVAADVTERRALEVQFRHAQKMEAVGLLAGGVAHDFNNMLSVILGYGQLLQGAVANDPAAAAKLGDILAAAQRAADLTRQLLAFSRKQVMRPTNLDLSQVVRGLERMLHRLIGEQVRLVTALEEHPWTSRADAGQIEQVVVNLVVNARDALTAGGTIQVGTMNVELVAPLVVSETRVPAGSWVALSVRDDGCGMEPEVRARIFEPFFTTKPTGRGTGLGLSTVYGIVRQSGGHVTVESSPGRGSAFTVYLPRVEGDAVAGPAADASISALRGTGTVLLVEDQAEVRDVVAATVGALGYQVLVASDAAEALVIFERYTGKIDILLSDVVMPGATGLELAQRLVALRPAIRVLLMSGYAGDSFAREVAGDPRFTFLEKPVTLTTLGRALADLRTTATGDINAS